MAWQNLYFRGDGYRPACFSSFLSALQRVAPSVRRLHVEFNQRTHARSTRFITALLPALAAVAPYLECLGMEGMSSDDFQTDESSIRMLSVVPGPMHSATRLVELYLGKVFVTGPPGMLATAFLAIAAADSLCWDGNARDNSLAIILNRNIVAASAAAGRPVRLIKFGHAHWGWLRAGRGVVRPGALALNVEALGVEGLAALSFTLSVFTYNEGNDDEGRQRAAQTLADGAMARVATLVARLPALRDLTVHGGCFIAPRPVVFDFRAVYVHALSRLVFINDIGLAAAEVRLPPTLAASLQILAFNDPHGFPVRPPGCVRNAGDALTRLTHLDYGVLDVPWAGPSLRWRQDLARREGESPDPTTNLSAWGNAAEYRLPALRFLTVWGRASFTVDGQGGRVGPSAQDWAAGVLRTLPCLERLTLVTGKLMSGTRDTQPLRPLFVYRKEEGEAPCDPREHCRSGLACAGARAVGTAIMKDLPAAGAAAGRRLAVRVMEREDDIRPAREVYPLEGCTLGYERAPR